MKDLSQYPTAETDAAWPSLSDDPDAVAVWCQLGLVRNLERRLAACREFIRDAIDYSHLEEMHKQPAEELLAATAPKP
jgi:hypothetical protein